MGELAFGQPPARLEVLRQSLFLLNSFQYHFVDILLLRCLRLRENSLGFWFALFEKFRFSGILATLRFFRKESIGDFLSNLVDRVRIRQVESFPEPNEIETYRTS